MKFTTNKNHAILKGLLIIISIIVSFVITVEIKKSWGAYIKSEILLNGFVFLFTIIGFFITYKFLNKIILVLSEKR